MVVAPSKCGIDNQLAARVRMIVRDEEMPTSRISNRDAGLLAQFAQRSAIVIRHAVDGCVGLFHRLQDACSCAIFPRIVFRPR